MRTTEPDPLDHMNKARSCNCPRGESMVCPACEMHGIGKRCSACGIDLVPARQHFEAERIEREREARRPATNKLTESEATADRLSARLRRVEHETEELRGRRDGEATVSLFAPDYEYVIHYSGGLSSHLAAHRMVEEVGAAKCVLLFADTKSEDKDLYRFIREGSAALGCRLEWLTEGRTIWQVFRDVRFLGNSLVDPCSKILKRDILDAWVSANAPDAVNIIGFTVCESERWDRFRARMPRSRAPLMEAPTIRADEVMTEYASLFPHIAPPRLYLEGAKHNNCGGGCVKAGQKHFDWLRKARPDTYAEWEREEESLRELLGNVSILTDRRGNGKKKPLSLRQFRERMEAGGCAVGNGAACRCMDPDPDTKGKI